MLMADLLYLNYVVRPLALSRVQPLGLRGYSYVVRPRISTLGTLLNGS